MASWRFAGTPVACAISRTISRKNAPTAQSNSDHFVPGLMAAAYYEVGSNYTTDPGLDPNGAPKGIEDDNAVSRSQSSSVLGQTRA